MSTADRGKKPDNSMPIKTDPAPPNDRPRNAEYKTVGELIRKQFSIGK